MNNFKLLRLGLGMGSTLMLVIGMTMAFKPNSVEVPEVRKGVEDFAKHGRFEMKTAPRPVGPVALLTGGGALGILAALHVKEDEVQVEPVKEAKRQAPQALQQLQRRVSVPAVQEQSAPLANFSTLMEVWEAEVPFSGLTQTMSLKSRIALLERSIMAHEGGWLDRLLCCPCLLVIGRPGSAKSSFGAALGICRELLIEGLHSIVVDPNAHLKVDDSVWQKHWEINGAGDNWMEIGDAINTMYKRFADSKGANYVSSIYDELTAYEGNVDARKLGGFLPQITSKARASEEYVILISHNDTLSCLGAKAGQAKLKDDMVQLNLSSKSTKRGKFIPAGKGLIEGLEFDERNKPLETPITLPRWFDPAILIQLFPEIYSDNSGEVNPSLYGSHTDNLGVSEVDEDPWAALQAEPPQNQSDNNETKAVPTYLSRVLACKQAQAAIAQELDMELKLRVVEEVLDAIDKGVSNTKIVKDIMNYSGRNFSKGQYMLSIIKQTLNTDT